MFELARAVVRAKLRHTSYVYRRRSIRSPIEQRLDTSVRPMISDACAADLNEIRTHRGVESSTLRAAINLTKCFIGAASFELPWAFAQAGVLGSLLGLLGLALLSSFSLSRSAACSLAELVSRRTLLREQLLTDVKHAPTLPEVGYAAFGTAGKWVTWFGVCVQVFTLFGCGSYLVFISS
jgi:hypothetical protein